MRRLIAKALWWLLEPERKRHEQQLMWLQAQFFNRTVGLDAGNKIAEAIEKAYDDPRPPDYIDWR